MLRVRRKATEISTLFLRFSDKINFTSEMFHHVASAVYRMCKELTPTMAGSFGIAGGLVSLGGAGGCSIFRSLTSVPLKTMYS